MKRLPGLQNLPIRAGSDEARAPRPLRTRRHLDSADVGELVARYEAGATVYDLADCFGIHRDRVSKLIKEAGVRVRDHERVEVNLEQAAKLEAQGLTLTEIAQALGIGRTTLVKARRQSGD